jgi:pyridoxamine 5'-phosphate oxidase
MNLYLQALQRFQDLLEEAKKLSLHEPLAMSLATADEKGRPSIRTVYLAGVDTRGLVFFTNRHSRKGRQLAANPYAAVCFFWQLLGQQVQVEGIIEPISEEESDAYWATRDHYSRLAAWVSRQSEPLDSRQTLKRRLEEYRQQFDFQPIPRPPYWCGYCLVPERFEFWKTGWGYLHERECYQKSEDEWTMTLLNP